MTQYAMMRVCVLLAALAVLGVATVAEADFLVVLRDGQEFTVDAYEVVGNKLVYTRFSGKVAIPKSLVMEIRDLVTGEKRIFNDLPPGSSKKPGP